MYEVDLEYSFLIFFINFVIIVCNKKHYIFLSGRLYIFVKSVGYSPVDVYGNVPKYMFFHGHMWSRPRGFSGLTTIMIITNITRRSRKLKCQFDFNNKYIYIYCNDITTLYLSLIHILL